MGKHTRPAPGRSGPPQHKLLRVVSGEDLEREVLETIKRERRHGWHFKAWDWDDDETRCYLLLEKQARPRRQEARRVK